MVSKRTRIHAYVWSGLVAALVAAFFIYGFVTDSEIQTSTVVLGIVSVIGAFTLLSCIILNNNFIWDMVSTIFSWGFVRMPGLIFTLDLDGIVWLLTVKLLFWLLNIALAILFAVLGIALGGAISILVYPFALYKAYNGKEMEE